MNKNFFTLVQDYRIMEAKAKLKSTEYQHLTVLQVAMECGFNSKSSFNALFKQYTGMTPSTYRSKAAQHVEI